MPKRCAIYVRVSTNKTPWKNADASQLERIERENSQRVQDYEMQLVELRAYASKRGFAVSEFCERQSAAKHRPEFERLVSAARSRQIDVVLVWKLDRFGRSVSQIVQTIDEFKTLGVEFISLRESFDMTTPYGQAMFKMIAVFAELERELIRERVIAGMENARRKGKRFGRSRTLDYAGIREARDKGGSIRAIAKRFGIHPGTVSKVLKSSNRNTDGGSV